MPSLWYSGDLGQEPFDWLVDMDEGRRRSADPVLVPVSGGFYSEARIIVLRSVYLSVPSGG